MRGCPPRDGQVDHLGGKYKGGQHAHERYRLFFHAETDLAEGGDDKRAADDVQGSPHRRRKESAGDVHYGWGLGGAASTTIALTTARPMTFVRLFTGSFSGGLSSTE